MQNTNNNRMATPANRAAAPLPLVGNYTCDCPSCGRGMQPRVTKTGAASRYFNCGLCGKPFRVDYLDGKPQKPVMVMSTREYGAQANMGRFSRPETP